MTQQPKGTCLVSCSHNTGGVPQAGKRVSMVGHCQPHPPIACESHTQQCWHVRDGWNEIIHNGDGIDL